MCSFMTLKGIGCGFLYRVLDDDSISSFSGIKLLVYNIFLKNGKSVNQSENISCINVQITSS